MGIIFVLMGVLAAGLAVWGAKDIVNEWRMGEKSWAVESSIGIVIGETIISVTCFVVAFCMSGTVI